MSSVFRGAFLFQTTKLIRIPCLVLHCFLYHICRNSEPPPPPRNSDPLNPILQRGGEYRKKRPSEIVAPPPLNFTFEKVSIQGCYFGKYGTYVCMFQWLYVLLFQFFWWECDHVISWFEVFLWQIKMATSFFQIIHSFPRPVLIVEYFCKIIGMSFASFTAGVFSIGSRVAR